MYFQHSAQIRAQFPQLSAGVLALTDIQPDVTVELNLYFQQARDRLQQYGAESKMPSVSAWRRAYSQMGFKPTKYRSAAEALLRRFKKEDNLPRLHPLVDLCNAISLAYALPVAVYDLDHVGSFLEVRHASGTEEHLAFNGSIEHPAPNEVIFADGSNHAHARRWTFRQSRQSTIRPESSQILIVSEGLHETATTDVEALINTIAKAVGEHWSPPIKQAMLTAEAPRVEL
ncbi:phenylalanine--tRNA ligase beta subunit-related protein [Anaerolineales bacterium HSG6]|nr:phenylalanine--tRNA ligase beta subunit-related protein [Anaerolineales bacterium HSG6]MDM8531549.1 phenylalanine--tRNA ligase beta subunit-related protein [Anaerolineales bacterium HSG25]